MNGLIPQTISARFIWVVVAVICVMVIPFSWLLSSQYREARQEANRAFVKEREVSTHARAHHMVQFLARISPEAAMGQDVYTLQVFGAEAMRDSSIVSLKILGMGNQALIDLKASHFAASTGFDSAHSIRLYETEIITDKQRLGIEQKVGRVEMRVSFAQVEVERLELEQALQARLRQVNLLLIIFTLALCLVLSFVIWLVLRFLVLRPLRQVSDRIRDIAEGEGDLTQRLRFGKENEMGHLAGGVDRFLEKLQELIRDLKERFGMLDQSLGMVNQGASRLESSTQVMGRQSAGAAEHTRSVAGEVGQVASNMGDLRSQIQNVSESVAQLSHALVAVSANSNLESQKSQEADKLTEESALMVESLSDTVGQVHTILETIQEIASQTRLLALNATIEAASAGEAGKGFSVVANEVKELARRTTDSIQGIQALVDNIRGKMGAAVHSISDVRGKVGEMKESSVAVSSAVAEQSQTMQSISERLSIAVGLTENVEAALSRSNQLLQSVSGNIAGLDVTVAESSEEVQKNVQAVHGASVVSAEVKSIIGRFRV